MSIIERYFTDVAVNPYELVQWENRCASISGADFEQDNVEFPKTWSQNAVNIVASKYFRGNGENREHSLKQLINRVVETICNWGVKGSYFDTDEEAQIFQAELTYILVYQYATFNSPVWFNIGWKGRKQCPSACYILPIEDTMESILDTYKTEGMIFKGGSGSGINLTPLRSSLESLTAGGKSSGPVSFMRGLDASAGSIKSGGATRRAALMRILDAAHPDVEEFITCKAKAEAAARVMIEGGVPSAFDDPYGAYGLVPFQNANHSVAVDDCFMEKLTEAKVHEYDQYDVHDKVIRTINKEEFFNQIAQATWECGDPGLFFTDTVNKFNKVPNSGKIIGSNPCGEYLHFPNTSCNLGSLNLIKFFDTQGDFDSNKFIHVARTMITAMDILIEGGEYPTPEIAHGTRQYRNLGLGYTNLGATLMRQAIPYDSDEGRQLAGQITSLLTATAYDQSGRLAEKLTPFPAFARNGTPMRDVLELYRDRQMDIEIDSNERRMWNSVLTHNSYRNAEVSCIAPAGTISFMMDCDTTGIEPELGLIKYKTLVGGGVMELVNPHVEDALRKLQYSPREISTILQHLKDNGEIYNAPDLREEHYGVFDTALGERSISADGHLKMLAAAQKFTSMGISKTCNVSNSATVNDIKKIYLDAWKQGVKAISVYRDGCKATQPLSTEKSNTGTTGNPNRHKLPNDRRGLCHKFSIAGHEGYIHTGEYKDGSLGEIFITMSKEGSTMGGLMDAFATQTSIALQHGVPLATMVRKFEGASYEPSGFTGNSDVPQARSITDYIFRWLNSIYGENKATVKPVSGGAPIEIQPIRTIQDGPPCPNCGALMVTSGTCHTCTQCGTTGGCG